MARGLTWHPEAREIFRQAGGSLGLDLLDLCLNGPEEELAQDFNAQMAVHVTNCAYAAVLKKMNLAPGLASGFSLGIFSALVAAGSLTFEQGLEGVKIAAEKMSAEGRSHHGAMAAVIGLAEQEVQAVCREFPRVYVASVNTAQQVVISGEEEEVEKAIPLFVQRGALLVKRLAIGWAIHTPLMERASLAFAEEIKSWRVFPPQFPVLSYLRGEPLKSPEEIKTELSAQFSKINYWHKVLLRMAEEGIHTFIEVGPGNVLTQMVRWVNRSARAIAAEEILKEGSRIPGFKGSSGEFNL
jgi:[acyl-carrier-protein] S-malonyltransferase